MTERDQEQRVGDEEFLSVARDPAVARMLRKQLEALADTKGGDSVLGEMAREVLSGRIGIREAVRVGAYEEALVQNIGKFREKWDEMTESEKAEAEKAGREFLQQQQDEIDQERRERTQGHGRHHG